MALTDLSLSQLVETCSTLAQLSVLSGSWLSPGSPKFPESQW